MKKERQSGIELLRIFIICGVVMLHYNSRFAFAQAVQGSTQQYILYVAENLFICAVNAFVLITGYFSVNSQKRSAVKAAELLLQVITFRLVPSLYLCLKDGVWTRLLGALLPVNYFVIFYVVLYLLSPYLNVLLCRLEKYQLRRLLILLVVLFCVYPTVVSILELKVGALNGLSSITFQGSANGYSIVQFVLMYCIGAGLRLLDVRMKKRMALLGYGVCAVLLYAWSLAEHDVAWSYCNPLIVAEAVFLFLLFCDLKFSNRVINHLAKAAFTCFLFHDLLLEYFAIAKAVSANAVLLPLHMLFTAGTIYLISWLVYLVWEFIMRRVRPWLQRLSDKLKIDTYITLPDETLQ